MKIKSFIVKFITLSLLAPIKALAIQVEPLYGMPVEKYGVPVPPTPVTILAILGRIMIFVIIPLALIFGLIIFLKKKWKAK